MKRISVIVFLVLVILCVTAFADNNVDPDQWPGVAALGLSNDVMMSIYNDYETAWLTYPDAIDEAMKYEEQVSKNIAEKYGITAEQADLVYGYVITNYEKVANDGIERNQMYTLRFGDLLSINNSAGSTAVIKAKIRPSMTNDMTIKQNYYNVCDLIQNQGFDIYQEIQYWAVADLTNGDEGKVISFTVPKDVIDRVAEGNFPENMLADYVEDLWILPSLLK